MVGSPVHWLGRCGTCGPGFRDDLKFLEKVLYGKKGCVPKMGSYWDR